MPTISPELIKLVDQNLVASRAAKAQAKAQGLASGAMTSMYKTTYPFLGLNPLSSKSVGSYLPTWGPMALMSGVAGGTALASPVLSSTAMLAAKLNPLVTAPSFTGASAHSILSLAKPGIALSTMPMAKLVGAAGLTHPMLPVAGTVLAPLALGLLARKGYTLYSRAGQAKRLGKLPPD